MTLKFKEISQSISIVILTFLITNTASAGLTTQEQRAEYIYQLSTKVTPAKNGNREIMLLPFQRYFSYPIRISGCIVTVEIWTGGYGDKKSQISGETVFNLLNVTLPNPNTDEFKNNAVINGKWRGNAIVTANDGHYIKSINLLKKPQNVRKLPKITIATRSFAAEPSRLIDFMKSLWSYQSDYCSLVS